MDKKYNNPSLDPANDNSLAGSIRFAFSKLIQNVNGMLPAQVISYDREANRAQVQILISLITTSGASVPRPQIASVPVLLIGGGGMFLSFPINTGDLGWIIANDRDISNFLQTYSTSVPHTYRISQFSDGLFVPDIMRGYTLSDDAIGSVVLQNTDGSVSISVSNTNISIRATDTVSITAPNVEINADTVTGSAGSLSISSVNDVTINSDENAIFTLNSGSGVLAVVGNITATGTITASTPPP